jgi:tetratricopeptide (TPR) repeat protein
MDHNNAAALYAKGFILYNLGNYNEAITFYSKSLEINPEDPEVVKFYKVKLTHAA